jgi:hypothetical protein
LINAIWQSYPVSPDLQILDNIKTEKNYFTETIEIIALEMREADKKYA